MPVPFTPSEKLLERVSRLYFLDGKTQGQIAEDLGVIELFRADRPAKEGSRELDRPLAQATVNRLLQRAKTLGVAAVSVDSAFAVELSRDSDLSRELRDAFGLEGCAVLYSAAPSPESDISLDGPAGSIGPTDPATRPEGAAEDREARLVLGLANYAARELQRSLAPGEHVLCGGGRTICWLARAVRRNPPTRRGLIFTPLGGRLWLEDWFTGESSIMERALDADDAVHILSEAFEYEPDGRFTQINQPLYVARARDAKRILEKHCALAPDGHWKWGLPPATRALVGVGSLASSGHRLNVFLERYRDNRESVKDSYLDQANTAEAIGNILEACGTDLPFPGDIGNRLFCCLPVPTTLSTLSSGTELLTKLKEIARQIHDLNARAVVMEWAHLRRSRHVIVIGGGQSKFAPMWTILLSALFDKQAPTGRERIEGLGPIVTELTTDAKTARLLLAELRTVERSPALLDWYRAAARTVGLVHAP